MRGDGTAVRLSLIHNPPRPFSRLFRIFDAISKGQAVVKPSDIERGQRDAVHVEVLPGVNVSIPLSRVRRLDSAPKPFSPGDIIFFQTKSDDFRINVSRAIPNQLTCLQTRTRTTVLTELWGGADYRRSQHMKLRGRIECNLIGFPQLKGRGQVSEDSLQSRDFLAQNSNPVL